MKHQMRLGELELWGEIRQSVCVKEIRISYKNGQFLGQNAQSHFFYYKTSTVIVWIHDSELHD